MTTYWRAGFWRSSVHGNVHWVEGHVVDRSEWDIPFRTQRDEAELRRARAHEGATSRFVQPNADCPVCGSPVFFYQNQFGSRVFFDELGPPWPKHPCTAHVYQKSTGEQVVTLTAERLRARDEADLILKWRGADDGADFEQRYGTGRWDIAVFIGVYESHGVNIVVIRTENGYRYFKLDERDNVPLVEGQLVTYYGSWLSFISPGDLEVTELKLRRIGAHRALHHILDIERLSADAKDTCQSNA